MKQFWKRCLSLLLALVLFAGMLPVITPQASAATASGQALADEAKKYDGWQRRDFVNAGTDIVNSNWCAWFVSYCAQKAGM